MYNFKLSRGVDGSGIIIRKKVVALAKDRIASGNNCKYPWAM